MGWEWGWRDEDQEKTQSVHSRISRVVRKWTAGEESHELEKLGVLEEVGRARSL